MGFRALTLAMSGAMPAKNHLQTFRDKIDRIDVRIHALLNERARCAQQVRAHKQAQGMQTADFYRPEREAQVLRNAIECNDGPLRDEETVRLFREIMSACLAQEAPLKIGFLGPEGTFSQQAVLKHFGHSVHALPLPAISEVFAEVQAGHADFGVVPIENSIEGTVNNTLDMFLSSPLKICGEVELRIHQHLMGRMKGMKRIERVCSHPQSLAQCRQWLDEHLAGIERIPVSSNAEAARRARDEDGTAAIAGQAAADVYGLNVIVPEIEGRSDNTTRFLVIGRKLFNPSGQDKTTLLISAGHSPGSLHRLLESFARMNISLTRIQSRPSRRHKWDYVFFIDVKGHADTAPLKEALEHLQEHASLCKVLGSYPCAVV